LLGAASLTADAGDDFDLAPDEPVIRWLVPERRHLAVFQGLTEPVTLTLDASALDPDTYAAQLLLETNDPSHPVVALPVTLEVESEVPVRLLGLRAESADLGVRLGWETADEVAHLGFHVYRREPGGEEAEISRSLITGDGTGVYVFEDREVEDGVEYAYRIADLGRGGELTFHGPVTVRYLGASGLARPVLRQNMPNPVRSATTVRFGLPETGPVSLRVYSVHGKLVRELAGSVYPAGYHELAWDTRDAAGRPVAAGFYTLRLETRGDVLQRKLVVVR
jgi:hypothetical protein